jgi:hypothetical protein
MLAYESTLLWVCSETDCEAKIQIQVIYLGVDLRKHQWRSKKARERKEEDRYKASYHQGKKDLNPTGSVDFSPIPTVSY